MRIKILFPLLLLSLMYACSSSNQVGNPASEGPTDIAATIDPISTFLAPTRIPGSPETTPTPDLNYLFFPTFTPLAGNNSVQAVVTQPPVESTYTVQDNDFWGSIADKLGVSVEDLLSVNNMTEFDIIYPGDTLVVPEKSSAPRDNLSNSTYSDASPAPYFKIIPDSELVYGPLSAKFNVDEFVSQKGGYLSTYTQTVTDRQLTGSQIVQEVSETYSVNPRLLLAILEYESGWVTESNPEEAGSDTPIAYVDDYYVGLYRQLMFTANLLNEGYYGWRQDQLTSVTLLDQKTYKPAMGTNAGTYAIQHFYSAIDDTNHWQKDVSSAGMVASYITLFGDPFDLTVDPIVPNGLVQPTYSLPFKTGETWFVSGGPHGGWDHGSAWAAIDFAPPGDPIGCANSDNWTTAIAPGVVVRSGNGGVVVDLDGDGIEQTGWTILYMHMATEGRISTGTVVKEGDPIGHPSCEGGQALASHLHIARRLNGEWIPAGDAQYPFIMSGFTASSSGKEYDGWLSSASLSIEAKDGYTDSNKISR